MKDNKKNKSRYNNYDAWILLIIPVGIMYWFALDYVVNGKSVGLTDWGALILITAVGWYFIVQWYNGYVTKCPKCKKWHVRRSDGSEGYSSHTYNTTKTVSDIVKNSSGEQIGTVERTVPITKKSSSWTDKWRCINCKHKWSTRGSASYEV
ncbi:hypothetical protein N9B83_00535 [Schleiferiaceae bacterium]|nr:hypothetical protein [Schleiferiaceae bacterium]